MIRFSKLTVAIFTPLIMAAITAVIFSTPAKATTYDVNLAFAGLNVAFGGLNLANQTITNPDTLQGTITTDGKIGVLTSSDITGFNLTMFAEGNSVALNSAVGASPFVQGSAFAATASSLTFQGVTATHDIVGFLTPSSSFILAAGIGDNFINFILPAPPPNFLQDKFTTGDLQIGSVSATPIPNSLSLLAPVLGLIFLLWRRDQRKSALALRTA